MTTDLSVWVSTTAARHIKYLFHGARRNCCPATFRSGTKPHTIAASKKEFGFTAPRVKVRVSPNLRVNPEPRVQVRVSPNFTAPRGGRVRVKRVNP